MQLLADARLRPSSRGASGRKTVELTHESLIQRWSKLRQMAGRERKDAGFVVAELRGRCSAVGEKNDRAEGLCGERAADEAGQWLERNKEKSESKEPWASLSESFRIWRRWLVYRSGRNGGEGQGAGIGSAFAFLGLIALVVSVLASKARSEARRPMPRPKKLRRAPKKPIRGPKEARNASRMASVRECL